VVPLFSGGSCKIPFLLVFFSANAKVAEYSSSRNCRSHLKAMQGTRFQSIGHRLRSRPSLAGSFRLAGAAFSVGAFNRKGQEPDSRLRISKMARETGRRCGSPLPPYACSRRKDLAASR
jgi:hypothetical protein